MKKIALATSSKQKVREISSILREFDIEVEHIEKDFSGDKEQTMEEIAWEVVKNLAEEYQRPVIIEKSGVYFRAYHNFPGALSRFVFNSIGYKGIFRLLHGKERRAYLKSIVAYCEPGGRPELFAGKMRGAITERIILPNKEGEAYDRIFIPDGTGKAVIEMTQEEKNAISQRADAVRTLGKYLQKNF